ncbi:hypothetical protein LOTGIDRAFT_158484 [Lottia gigantea]|uniref:Endonuclease/exonuclease/phosphatase domain-containing protein n=1 Tax=Lottia gigantea TaxID=225164 RepID=V4AQA7_LOTGI|nr:hypothetical protein LOTGIDRAFT_158484 [Lottia gigantea]ESO99397.1 hypothetical protein LOTGIDRAFT_158484 [Lottia gigantea]
MSVTRKVTLTDNGMIRQNTFKRTNTLAIWVAAETYERIKSIDILYHIQNLNGDELKRKEISSDNSSDHSEENTEKKTTINSLNLTDIYRQTYPSTQSYTYSKTKTGAARLDRIYLSKTITPNVQEIKHLPQSVGDHKAVSLKLRLKRNRWGKSYWKMNTQILKDEKYIEHIKYYLDYWHKNKQIEGIRRKNYDTQCFYNNRIYEIGDKFYKKNDDCNYCTCEPTTDIDYSEPVVSCTDIACDVPL